MARRTNHTESQQMLALPPLLKKSDRDDKEVKQLRAQVARDQKELKTLLEDRVGQTEKETTRRNDEVAALIADALKSSNRSAHSEQLVYMGTKIAGNAVYIATTDVLAASEDLLAEYNNVENMVTALQDNNTEPVADKWKHDIEKMEKQLKMGARVSIRNVKKVLGAEVEDENVAMADEDGNESMEGIEGAGQRELNFELQNNLRYAERGVKRMVKGLPADELD